MIKDIIKSKDMNREGECICNTFNRFKKSYKFSKKKTINMKVKAKDIETLHTHTQRPNIIKNDPTHL